MENYKNQINKIKKVLKNSKKIFVFFDSDLDGACSYIQIKNTYKNAIGFPIRTDLISQKNALQYIKKDIDCFLFLDTPTISDEVFEKLENKKIIIVDHHQTSKDLGKKYGALNFNPLNYNQFDNRATSFWAYCLSDSKSMNKNLFWATFGSVGDFFLLDLISKLHKKNKKDFYILFKNISLELQTEIFNFLEKNSFDNDKFSQRRNNLITKLEFETEFIKYKMFFDLLFKLENQKKSVKVLEKISSYTHKEIAEKITNGKESYFTKFRKVQKIIKKEIEVALKNSPTKILWHTYKNEISITRQIAEELMFRCEKSEVIVCAFENIKKNSFAISFRTKKIDINSIILKSIIGLQARGGGHKNSAGSCVSKKDYQEFKRRILENLRTLL